MRLSPYYNATYLDVLTFNRYKGTTYGTIMLDKKRRMCRFVLNAKHESQGCRINKKMEVNKMRKLNELLKQIQELPNYDCKESWELFRTLDISVDKELVNREDLPTMVFIAILARGGNGFEHNYIRGSEKIIVSIVPCLDCGIKGSVKYKYQSEIDDIPDGK